VKGVISLHEIDTLRLYDISIYKFSDFTYIHTYRSA